MLQLRAVRFRRLAGRGEIDCIVLCRDPAGEREDRPHAGGEFRGDDSERVGLAFDNLRGTALGAEIISERLLEGRLTDERRRQPYARRPGGFQDFDTRRHFEGAPTARRCAMCKQAPRLRERKAGGHDARGSQKIATVHRPTLSI